jgi:hypothetical protein
MTLITPDIVLAAADKLLAGRGGEVYGQLPR